VLDSTGKTPDGILADVVYLCDFINEALYPNVCGIIKAISPEIGETLEQLIIPGGNTIGFGSFEGKP